MRQYTIKKRENRTRSIFEGYFLMNESLVEKTISSDEFTRIIDIDELPPAQKRMAYGMLAKGGYEFTDVESAEFFDMLNAPGEDLSDDELAFMLKDVEIAPEDGGDET